MEMESGLKRSHAYELPSLARELTTPFGKQTLSVQDSASEK